MLLSSIQVQGFKSFADKTVLKFGKGITAVVGPNGSGKSNISDAVRWVLGEQSTKTLRGQSMEDVIFGGTDNRRPHGFCEVTLNIDNSDRTLNFDNDSISVTRRYYRSHESEYLINGVSVRLKDVHELFMDTGLGRDGYSMIGQGKIDTIISSKSDERRDIFEEASGISKYRYRKTEAEKKLTAAEDNLLRLKDIMDELESRVGPLKEQSEKAEKFLNLAENKKQLEIGLWLYTLDNSKDLLRAQESKIEAAELKYREIENALSDFDIESEKNSEKFSKLTSDIENIRAAIALFNEQSVKLEGTISVFENDIIHNEETVKRLECEKAELNNSDSAAKEEIELKKSLAAEKETVIKESKDNLIKAEEELSGLLSDSENLSGQIEELTAKLNELSALESDEKVVLITSQSSLDQIKERKTSLLDIVKSNKSESEKTQKEIDETTELLNKTEENINSLSNTLGGYELRLKNRMQTVEELTKKFNEIKLDIDAKNRRIQILGELEKNMEGFSNAVKTVMSQAQKGLLRGIYGPVSKVITVDKKYSVAIETALNNSIQNIIVENEADAKRAISALKSSNSGRATFMPVSTMKAREFKEKGFEDHFGFVGIASDLVKTDEKYSEIIRYLLGATVVAEDIDSAAAIAKKHGNRIKVVSLDGQVVNAGGSFTGGSLVKQAGMLSRAADIKRLERNVAEQNEALIKVSKELESAKSELNAVNADITAVKADITTANEDKIRTVAEIKRIEGIFNNLKSVLSDLETELTDGDRKEKELSDKIISAQNEIEKITAEKAKLQNSIEEKAGSKGDLSEKREQLSEKITAVKLKIITDEKDVNLLLQQAVQLENSIENRISRASEIDSEIAAVQFKINGFKDDISSSKDKIADLSFKVKEANENIEKKMEERNAVEKKGVELRNSEKERTSEREKISGELARLTERKEVMMSEYDGVIRQLFDEYQLTKSEAEKIGIKVEKPQEAKRNLAEIKSKIRALGNVNVSAIEEYKEVKERYDFMTAQIDDVEKSRAELHKLINQLTSQMQELFVVGFNKINENFSKTFKDLFGGGEATLKLTDPDNILESGIDIDARLPGKNVPSLEGLSGGEKALVALSIYFAIMEVNAPPFCFLDEVDTALDDINVERFADYMKRSDFDTQFICVTHRRGTMEAADMLYGVTMQEKGVTKLLELNVAELEKNFDGAQIA